MEISSAVFFLLCASPYLLAREAEVFKGADSVALPCHYYGVIPGENPTVIWRRHDLDPQTVHLWPENDALHEQNQRFSGRTSMRPDALDSRDFSLNLRKIHLSDTGTYTCSIDDGREEFKLSEVKLWINGHQEEVKTKVGVEFITLPCKITADVGDDVIVKWSRPQPEFVNIFEYQNGSRVFKEQDDIYCGRTSMSKDRVKSGDLSLTLSYPTERDSGVFLCTIYMKSSIVRQTVLLECIKETFPTWSKVLLILVILLLLAVSGGLLYFRSQAISVHSLEVNSGKEPVLLPCKTIFPLPKNVCIKWTNSSGSSLLKGYRKSGVWTTEKHGYFKDRIEMVENQKSNFSLTLKNPVETDTDTYTCTISNLSERILATTQVQLKVKGGDNCKVIAIDIGFGYSGYAFNLKPRKEGGEAQFKQWDEELGLYYPKTPTCILFDENGNFLKFGYEAKTVYNKMGKEEAEKHYFFEEFKANLREKDWSRTIKYHNKKSMTIMKVVTEVLKFMKDDALKTIEVHPEGGKLRACDITWVVTIPGHWDYWTIYFLTDAAIQAGLVAADDTGKVMFINEAEAALAWCLKHPSDDLIAQNSPARPPGPTDAGTSCSDPSGQVAVHPESEETIVLMETQTGDGNQRRNPATDTSDGKRYIVVNCGETIEFNVYEVLDGRATKKKYEIYNDYKGGRSVDMKFRIFLLNIFQELWEEYEENFPNEVQELMINFLRVKHLDEEVWIRCPENLKEQVAKEKDIERFFDSVEGASWDNGGIRISREILRLLYEEIRLVLSAYINNILGKNFNIGSIVLVGGLAQSPILRQSITEEFGSDYKVLCPLRPQEVILKSAIELARNPKLVSFPKKAAGRFKCFS